MQHGGRQADERLTGRPIAAPWDDSEKHAAALTTAEVEAVIQDFVDAAGRAEKAGFDGAEIHGATAATSTDFQLGLRLSPERYGIVVDEARALAREVLGNGRLDYLDLSLVGRVQTAL